MVKEKTEKKTKKTVRKKKVIKKPKAKKLKKSVSKKAGSGKYFEAVGRRKTAVARVRIFPRVEKVILVNNKSFDIYFPMRKLQERFEEKL